jgi:hypothetical protein
MIKLNRREDPKRSAERRVRTLTLRAARREKATR